MRDATKGCTELRWRAWPVNEVPRYVGLQQVPHFSDSLCLAWHQNARGGWNPDAIGARGTPGWSLVANWKRTFGFLQYRILSLATRDSRFHHDDHFFFWLRIASLNLECDQDQWTTCRSTCSVRSYVGCERGFRNTDYTESPKVLLSCAQHARVAAHWTHGVSALQVWREPSLWRWYSPPPVLKTRP